MKHTRSLATGWKAPLKVRPLSREPCPDPDSAASAQGVEYTRSLATGWKAPLKVRRLSEDDAQGIRDRFHIIVEGEHLPAPIIDFADMKLPPAVRATGPAAPARRPCRPGPRRQRAVARERVTSLSTEMGCGVLTVCAPLMLRAS